jgi:hypothetical protein
VAAVEADFFGRLARDEHADLRHVFDDQYISNAGQLVLLALGSYRMIADLRALLAARAGVRTTTSKPYDLAGAVLCARRAGCVVTAGDGTELDFALDCTTPVHFAGWTNAATARRLAPHLSAAVAADAADAADPGRTLASHRGCAAASLSQGPSGPALRPAAVPSRDRRRGGHRGSPRSRARRSRGRRANAPT